MNKSKKIAISLASILLVFSVLFSFAACNTNPKVPEYTKPDIPEEIITDSATYVQMQYETVTSAEGVTTAEGEEPATLAEGETTEAPKMQLVEKTGNVEVIKKNYFTYHNCVAEIESIIFEDDGYSVDANGYANIKVTQIAKGESEMKIAYKAYDANGEICKDSYMLVKLDGVKEGDVVADRRISLPRDAVKIVFEDYVPSSN